MPQNDSGKLLNVIAKSWTDDAYKKKLMADPKSVLADEGIEVPPEANVKVIDQQPNDMHLILPPKPAGEINVHNVASQIHSTMPMTFGPAHPGIAAFTFAGPAPRGGPKK
jgi:Nitrile hydratase, alpha chain